MVHHMLTDPMRHWLERQGHAYLANLLYHTTGSGVELFFVLSGVVLLRPYLRGRRKFNTNSYLRRRVERLFPPYLVALCLEAFVAWLVIRYPTWLTRETSHVEFSFNGFAKQLGIVSFGWPHYNAAWWSLSVEVLFYLIVPLLIPFFAWQKMNRTFLGAVGVISIALGVLFLPWVNNENPDTWTSLQRLAVYSSCFLLGIAIAKYDWPARAGWVMVICGSAYVLIATAVPQMVYHVGYGFLYAGLMVIALSPGNRLAPRLSGRLMLWIGERSYSLFLIHFTAFFAANYVASRLMDHKNLSYLLLTRVGGITLAVFGAMLMFQWIERRFARNLVTADQFWPPIFPSKRAK